MVLSPVLPTLSTGASIGTTSHIILVNKQHDECNSVINGTISIMWQEAWYCHLHSKNQYTPQMLHISHIFQFVQPTYEMAISVYILHINWLQSYYNKYWYTYISYYWHMPLNKYAYHTALILQSICRPHITAHTSSKSCILQMLTTMLLSYLCH